MASCVDGLILSELLGDELFEDYFDTTTESSASASSTEFKTASNEDLERLIANTENKNTREQLKHGLIGLESPEISYRSYMNYHQRSLDKILQCFYAELMKSDGTDYEPESLKVMIACLDRHLWAVA